MGCEGFRVWGFKKCSTVVLEMHAKGSAEDTVRHCQGMEKRHAAISL